MNLRTLRALAAITLIVPVVVPMGEAEEPQTIVLGPPFQEAATDRRGSCDLFVCPGGTAVGVAEPSTGALTTAAVAYGESFVAPNSYSLAAAEVASRHTLLSAAESISYHASVRIHSAEASAVAFESSHNRIELEAVHESCGSCSSWTFVADDTFSAEEDLVVGVVLRNWAGGPLPPGTIRAAVRLVSFAQASACDFRDFQFVNCALSSQRVVDAYEARATATVTDLRATIVEASIPSPDLVVDAISMNPIEPVEGDGVTFQATIRNGGLADAGAFVVEFAVDGAPIGSASVSGLRPGASTAVTASWAATSGAHVVRATADAAQAIPETDETNNGGETSFTVSARPIRGVDLSPASQSKSVAPKGTVVYDITVTNTGDASDTILLSHSGNQSGWRASLSTSSATLAPGASKTVQLTIKAPQRGSTFVVTVTGASQADSSIKDSSTAETTLSS